MTRDLDHGSMRTFAAGFTRAGFTLLEVLVAMLIGGIVICAELTLLGTHATVSRRAQAELGATGAAAWALSVVARDLELAGADPKQAGVIGISQPSAERVSINTDLDGDGAIDLSSAERVTISWSEAGGGRLLRQLGNQAMNIAAPVPPGGFRLRYFASDGTELLPGAGLAALDPVSTARVKRVNLKLTVTEPWGARTASATLETSAALRARSESR